MTPYYADAWLTLYAGDCRKVLATLPDESVHCVVTSPPYHLIPPKRRRELDNEQRGKA